MKGSSMISPSQFQTLAVLLRSCSWRSVLILTSDEDSPRSSPEPTASSSSDEVGRKRKRDTRNVWMNGKSNCNTHTHLFNGPLSRTTRVSRDKKAKPIWILLKQETVSGSGISWAICKSAPRSRQTTAPAPHHSIFYRPDALTAAWPTASKHVKLRQREKVVRSMVASSPSLLPTAI